MGETMGKKYRIREVAEMIGISPSVIRHYEEKGLVAPEKDPRNGYRLFSEEDIFKIWDITFFRSFDMGLHEIDYLFRSGDLNRRMEIISEHRKKLTVLLEAIKRNLLLCDFTERYALRAKESEMEPYISEKEIYRLYPAGDFFSHGSPSFPICTFGYAFEEDAVSRYTVVFGEDMGYLDLQSGQSLVVENAISVTVGVDSYSDLQVPLNLAIQKAESMGFKVTFPYYLIFLLHQGDDSRKQVYYYRVLLTQE